MPINLIEFLDPGPCLKGKTVFQERCLQQTLGFLTAKCFFVASSNKHFNSLKKENEKEDLTRKVKVGDSLTNFCYLWKYGTSFKKTP